MISDNPLEISCQLAKDLLNGENSPLLIDCREQHEYEFCHIEGSILVPLSDFAGKAEALFQDADQTAIVYCHHGVRSLYATQYLHAHGYTKTLSMQGGIDTWSMKVDAGVARY